MLHLLYDITGGHSNKKSKHIVFRQSRNAIKWLQSRQLVAVLFTSKEIAVFSLALSDAPPLRVGYVHPSGMSPSLLKVFLPLMLLMQLLCRVKMECLSVWWHQRTLAQGGTETWLCEQWLGPAMADAFDQSKICQAEVSLSSHPPKREKLNSLSLPAGMVSLQRMNLLHFQGVSSVADVCSRVSVRTVLLLSWLRDMMSDSKSRSVQHLIRFTHSSGSQ